MDVPDVTARRIDEQTLELEGITTDAVGLAAAQEGITLLELTQLEASLEEAYMAITEDALEFSGSRRQSGTPDLIDGEDSHR
jgi:ABC-2 type transport system ATP-binding protein